MNLNKIKIYYPTAASKSGSSISDEPYDEVVWDNDPSNGASRNAIRDKIESMGYAGNFVIVDSIYGNDSTGRAGNLLKPFKTHSGIFYLTSGIPGLCLTMPGTYEIANSFGLPMRNGVDHLLLNATINVTATFAYGSVMIYPSPIKSRIYGNGTINLLTTDLGWAQITPYVQCDLVFDGITFNGPKQLIGQQGSFQQPKFLRFKNCIINQNNNIINPATGAMNYNAFGDTYSVFEDCRIKGSMLVSMINPLMLDEYILKYRRCTFESIDTNANAQKAALVLLDYNANDQVTKVLVDHCQFKSNHENIFVGEGYYGLGTNKYLSIDSCRFSNGASEGWIINNHPGAIFKMIDNWSAYGASGTAPVLNTLIGAGIITDPNLEVVL